MRIVVEAASTRVAATGDPVLSVRNLTKHFGAITALEDISIDAYGGEVLALLGDNGAGKSTLIKCVSGVHRFESGEIFLQGMRANFRSPEDARDAGIETVYQDLALFDNADPTGNLYAGREISGPAWLPRGLRVMRRKAMEASTATLIERLKIGLPDFRASISMMSGGQRQAIAVARSVNFASRVVILDEPTAALGLRESRQVLDLVAQLKSEGIAIILITHNMDHVTELADRAVVIRRGRYVGEEVPGEAATARIVSMIIGA